MACWLWKLEEASSLIELWLMWQASGPDPLGATHPTKTAAKWFLFMTTCLTEHYVSIYTILKNHHCLGSKGLTYALELLAVYTLSTHVPWRNSWCYELQIETRSTQCFRTNWSNIGEKQQGKAVRKQSKKEWERMRKRGKILRERITAIKRKIYFHNDTIDH